jgi:hypothetical protein
MAGSGLRFFFIFDFSLALMPLDHGKERCKAKANKKAIRTSFSPDPDSGFSLSLIFL